MGIEAVEKDEIKQYADLYSTVHSTEQDIFVVADGARNGLILKGKKGAVGSTLFCITPLWIDTDYLYYFLKLNEIQRKDTRHVENTFWDTPVPIVSLEKQKQIANNIKEALSIFEQQNKEAELTLVKSLKSLVSTTVDVLESIQSLDSLKKAVLNLAVSGKLTEDPNSIKTNHIQSFFGGTISLPDSWKVQKLTDVCDRIFDGTHNSPKNSDNGDFKYITAKNIKITGIDLSQITYISSEDHNEIYKNADVKFNDILYVKDGTTTGVATINNLQEEFSILSSVAVFRPQTSILNPKYLVYYLNSHLARTNILSQVSGAAISRLTLDKLKNSDVIIPPINEQSHIIKIIDSIFEGAEKINQNYTNEKNRQEELQKAVLSSFYKDLTFDGNLEDFLTKIELARSKKDLEINDLRKKQKQFRDKLSTQPKMEIIDILKSSDGPMYINDLWGKSKYNGNIDAFYEALKQEFEVNSIKWELMDESSEIPQSHISLNQLPA